MEAAPGQQHELARKNQYLPGTVAQSWAGDGALRWGTLSLSHAGDRDWGWARQQQDGMGPRDGHGGTEVHWGQCPGPGRVTPNRAGAVPGAGHSDTDPGWGQCYG